MRYRLGYALIAFLLGSLTLSIFAQSGPIPPFAQGPLVVSGGGGGGSPSSLTSPVTLNAPFVFKPSPDSTTAICFDKADGSTNVMCIDTTNRIVSINAVNTFNAANGAFTLGSGNINGTIATDSSGTRVVFANVPVGFSSTGSVTSASTNDTALSRCGPACVELNTGVVAGAGTVKASQVRLVQPAPPTVCATCGGGVGPFVVGGDSGGIVQMGTGGTPTSGFFVSFAVGFGTNPGCVVTPAKSGMVVGKSVISAPATTGGFVVNTNGTAPSVNDQYAYHCFGVS